MTQLPLDLSDKQELTLLSDLIADLRADHPEIDILDAGNSDRFYSEADQLLEHPAFDYECAGAWLTGKDSLDIIRKHSPKAELIEKRIRTILEQETDPDGPLAFIGELSTQNPERIRRLLAAYLSGFNGDSNPF